MLVVFGVFDAEALWQVLEDRVREYAEAQRAVRYFLDLCDAASELSSIQKSRVPLTRMPTRHVVLQIMNVRVEETADLLQLQQVLRIVNVVGDKVQQLVGDEDLSTCECALLLVGALHD